MYTRLANISVFKSVDYTGRKFISRSSPQVIRPFLPLHESPFNFWSFVEWQKSHSFFSHLLGRWEQQVVQALFLAVRKKNDKCNSCDVSKNLQWHLPSTFDAGLHFLILYFGIKNQLNWITKKRKLLYMLIMPSHVASKTKNIMINLG